MGSEMCIRDRPSGKGRPHIWLIKPNVAELSEIVGRKLAGDDEIIEAGRRLSQHVRTVLVSCGEAGGYAFVDGSAMMGQVTVDPQRVTNTVGCGDALLAGFVAGQLRGKDIRQSYRLALAVATAAAVSLNPGQFNPCDVDAFLAVTTVEPITPGHRNAARRRP